MRAHPGRRGKLRHRARAARPRRRAQPVPPSECLAPARLARPVVDEDAVPQVRERVVRAPLVHVDVEEHLERTLLCRALEEPEGNPEGVDLSRGVEVQEGEARVEEGGGGDELRVGAERRGGGGGGQDAVALERLEARGAGAGAAAGGGEEEAADDAVREDEAPRLGLRLRGGAGRGLLEKRREQTRRAAWAALAWSVACGIKS